jgi:hypothetical protein
MKKGLSVETDQEQYQRFRETAREHGCEENVDRLDEVIRRAAKLPATRPAPKKRGKPKPKD